MSRGFLVLVSTASLAGAFLACGDSDNGVTSLSQVFGAGAAAGVDGGGGADGGGFTGFDGGGSTSVTSCGSNVSLTGLVAYLPFDGTTNARGPAGQSVVAESAGGVTFSSGVVGQAAVFDGEGYVQLAASLEATSQRTVCAWVASGGSSEQLGDPIVTFGTSGSGDFLGLNATTGPCATSLTPSIYVDHWGSACTPSHYGASASSGSSAPVFACWVATGPQVAYWVNGSNLGGAPYTMFPASWSVSIGGNQIGGTSTKERFIGAIDEVTLWARALAASEIATMYNGGSGCRLPL
jgi:hypothetical protein